MAGNRCYYVLQNVLRSKNISQEAKLNMYKTIIRPVLTYGCETWTQRDKSHTNIWGKKVLRKICGPVNYRGNWKIRSNKELSDLYQDTDLVTVIKILRLRWLGHICRMKEQRDPKKALEGKPGERRKRRKPQKRWTNNVTEDLRKTGLKIRRIQTADMKEWRGTCEVAKVLQELLHHGVVVVFYTSFLTALKHNLASPDLANSDII
jgi:hypothetical protein